MRAKLCSSQREQITPLKHDNNILDFPITPTYPGQTWVGPVLLFINPYEPPGPAMHTGLRQLAQTLLTELSESKQPRALIFK